MDRPLEHLLLVVDLLEELPSKLASMRVTLDASAIGFNLEQFLRRDFSAQPFTKIH
jgi:hypothetical protein